tara:strand:+ start:213 stop:353 length:141 start_codon:yes stop_codon:yes gene_type:complete
MNTKIRLKIIPHERIEQYFIQIDNCLFLKEITIQVTKIIRMKIIIE